MLSEIQENQTLDLFCSKIYSIFELIYKSGFVDFVDFVDVVDCCIFCIC